MEVPVELLMQFIGEREVGIYLFKRDATKFAQSLVAVRGVLEGSASEKEKLEVILQIVKDSGV